MTQPPEPRRLDPDPLTPCGEPVWWALGYSWPCTRPSGHSGSHLNHVPHLELAPPPDPDPLHVPDPSPAPKAPDRRGWLQSISLHWWRRGKHGRGRLDCRECRLCGRFEIIGYGNWHRTDRARFPDAVFP